MDLASVERSVQGVGEGVLLVDPIVLRRVIKRHGKVPVLGLGVPHARCYALGRDALLGIVDPADLGRAPASLPDEVILLCRPEPDELAGGPSQVLARIWQESFHARVHLELERRFADGPLADARIRERIHRIGEVEFDEIRLVLRHDEHLLPPRDDRAAYVEFAALYLELARFAPDLLARTFPALDRGAAESTIALDLDPDRLLAETRPEGAALPADAAPDSGAGARERSPEGEAPAPASGGGDLLDAAARARDKGNAVRAALLALATRGGEEAARGDVDALAGRLARALAPRGGDPSHVNESLAADRWAPMLLALARRAVARQALWRRAEARLLYDLQSACVAHERPARAIDLARWARSFGREPLVRPLPATTEVRVARSLRAAAKRLHDLRLPAGERGRLEGLVHHAVEQAEENIRDALRPAVTAALAGVGLRPENVPEQVAARKVAEELLDHVVGHGFLGMGVVRDALSRNQLKLPDIEGPAELVRGDALLRLNERLAASLDGVYRGGEVYLRGLQKLSSVVFGTRPGRLFTRYVVLPFGSAYVLLEGATHMAHPIAKHVFHHHGHLHLLTPVSYAITSAVLFALIHSSSARAGALAALRAVGWLLAAIFVRVPRWIATRPIVRAIARSAPVRLAGRYLLKPLAIAAILLATPLRASAPRVSIPAVTIAFVLANLALNTRAGARIEEALLDGIARNLRYLRRRVLPGLYRLIVENFRALLDVLERGLYTVDEKLRFREGELPAVRIAKAVLGLLWSIVAYLVRIYTNLLVEPQINPIKHFPVVTVAAKIMLPFAPVLIGGLTSALGRVVGTVIAGAIAGPTVVLLPGVFGFLVWEFKENWKLYRANRPADLHPVPIGHHGETMAGLLRPGFHSGTIPKLFVKLRRAERRGGAAAHSREALREVEHAVRAFVERELCRLLASSAAWTRGPVEVRAVKLGSNRVRVELGLAGPADPCAIVFEEQSGYVLASVPDPGWARALDGDARVAFEDALAGLYELAAVDAVREEVEAVIGGGGAPPPYDFADEGLVVWPGGSYRAEAVYALEAGSTLAPRMRGEPGAAPPPSLDRRALLFRERPIPWSAWVAAWSAPSPPRLASGAPLVRGS